MSTSSTFRVHRFWAPVIVSFAFLVPGRVLADEVRTYVECAKEPTEAELEAAKGAYHAGNVAFKEANYDRAIAYWEDAYDRDCTAHALLLNLARAYELAGQKRQAIVALETFLSRVPNTDEKVQILRRTDTLKASLNEQAAPVPAEGPAKSEKAAASPRKAPTKSTNSTVPVIIAVAGGAALVTGGVLYFVANSKLSDVDGQCFRAEDCGRDRNGTPRSNALAQDLVDDGNGARSLQTVGIMTAGVGAAALLGGIGWYVLTARKRDADPPVKTAAAFAISPKFSGFVLNGAF